ncbi:glycosyl transferase [Halopseudomonas bauzanensis]|nr:glycosyl transferase [Halopseudomonas bauzanensis]
MSADSGRRVLQFCHGYDGPFLDCARQYAALFDGTGYKVTTVFLTGEPDPAVAAGCNSEEVIFMNYSSASIRGLKLKAIRQFKAIAAKRDYKFCIAHRSKPTYIACLATKLPVIGVHHAFDDFKRFGRQLFARWFCKRLYLLAVSNAVRDDITAHLSGWPKERIQTLYNRIDVVSLQEQQLGRAAARKHLSLPADAWVVGNVGRLHPDKDHATLLRAFARALPTLPAGALLAILGKGPLESSLKTLSNELGIAERTLFLGQVPEAKRYFKAFDVFALSSDHEPFGMVLLEAMTADLPVIVSACGGAPEVVGDCGLLFPLGDDEQLANSLKKVSDFDEAQLEHIKQNMQDRLTRLFSDAAARSRFWHLSWIGEIERKHE